MFGQLCCGLDMQAPHHPRAVGIQLAKFANTHDAGGMNQRVDRRQPGESLRRGCVRSSRSSGRYVQMRVGEGGEPTAHARDRPAVAQQVLGDGGADA